MDSPVPLPPGAPPGPLVTSELDTVLKIMAGWQIPRFIAIDRWVRTGSARSLDAIPVEGAAAWTECLTSGIGRLADFTPADRRALQVIVRTGRLADLRKWLDRSLTGFWDAPEETHARFREELTALGVGEDAILAITASSEDRLRLRGATSSAGRWLLEVAPERLAPYASHDLVVLFHQSGAPPERVLAVARALLARMRDAPGAEIRAECRALHDLGRRRFGPVVLEAFRAEQRALERFRLGREVLELFDPKGWCDEILEAARAALALPAGSYPDSTRTWIEAWIAEHTPAPPTSGPRVTVEGRDAAALPAEARVAILERLADFLDRIDDPDPAARAAPVELAGVEKHERGGFSFRFGFGKHAGAAYVVSHDGRWLVTPVPVLARDLDAAKEAFLRFFDTEYVDGRLEDMAPEDVAALRREIHLELAWLPGEPGDPESASDRPLCFMLANPDRSSDKAFYCGYDPSSGESTCYAYH